MLLPWLTLFDLRGVVANFMPQRKINYTGKYSKSEDFVIMIPIFNDVKYLTNINFLRKYSGKVVLCTTNIETPKFYKDIYKIANENGFKVIKCAFKKEVKNPWKIYHKTLLAHDYVLGESLKVLKAKYVIFLDADTTCKTNLSYLVGLMEKHNSDIASVRVIPSKKETITENLQGIEYHVAMKSRRIYPWLTSGAAMIARRESMQEIMKKHSLFFNGGDIEIGKIAHLTGMKVDHFPVTFYTDVPETFQRLVKQRFSWFCGAFRHSVINAHTNLFSPIYALYFTLLIFIMLPFKVYELFFHWFVIPFLMLFYIMVLFVSNWEIRSKYMFIFPFYSLIQVILFPFMGIYQYTKTVYKTKNIGLIKIFYKHKYHPLKYIFNISLIALIAFTIFNLSFVEGKLLLANIDLLALIGITFQSSLPYVILYNGFKLFIIMTGLFLFLFGFFSLVSNFKNSKKIKRFLTAFF